MLPRHNQVRPSFFQLWSSPRKRKYSAPSLTHHHCKLIDRGKMQEGFFLWPAFRFQIGIISSEVHADIVNQPPKWPPEWPIHVIISQHKTYWFYSQLIYGPALPMMNFNLDLIFFLVRRGLVFRRIFQMFKVQLGSINMAKCRLLKFSPNNHLHHSSYAFHISMINGLHYIGLDEKLPCRRNKKKHAA